MSEGERRSFSVEFKLKAVERLEAGESASALAVELGVKRTILYRWRDRWRAGGAEAVRSGPGRPNKADALVMARARGPAIKAAGLAQARRQIAELERKVGQQQLDLDFFKGALRRIEEARRLNAQPGAPASSLKSKR
jgi:transposase-like protein